MVKHLMLLVSSSNCFFLRYCSWFINVWLSVITDTRIILELQAKRDYSYIPRNSFNLWQDAIKTKFCKQNNNAGVMYLLTNKIVSYLTQTLNLIIHAKQDKLLLCSWILYTWLFSPFYTWKRFCPVLNSPIQSYVKEK